MSRAILVVTHRNHPWAATHLAVFDVLLIGAAPGASFVPLAFEQSAHTPQPGLKAGASAPNRFYMYGVIGRLAMLAASYELEATDPDAEIYD